MSTEFRSWHKVPEGWTKLLRDGRSSMLTLILEANRSLSREETSGRISKSTPLEFSAETGIMPRDRATLLYVWHLVVSWRNQKQEDERGSWDGGMVSRLRLPSLVLCWSASPPPSFLAQRAESRSPRFLFYEAGSVFPCWFSGRLVVRTLGSRRYAVCALCQLLRQPTLPLNTKMSTKKSTKYKKNLGYFIDMGKKRFGHWPSCNISASAWRFCSSARSKCWSKDATYSVSLASCWVRVRFNSLQANSSSWGKVQTIRAGLLTA